MATTHLTDSEAAELNLPEVIRRVQSGEEIHVDSAGGTVLITKPQTPRMDNSLEATLARLKQYETENGEALRIGTDFADDLARRVGMRKPRDTSQWD